jgi:aminoglycoside phosphotransferase family enzyme/predicted kinase
MSEAVSIADQLSAASFPHPVAELQRRETVLSCVLLTGSYAYKIRKPVRLPFVDATTLERRRFLSEEELRLNRRFAPQLYVDVVPITLENGQPRIGGNGPAVEYAVRMHQFGPEQELSRQLEAGRPEPHELAEFGAQLADWHTGAARADPDRGYGRVELVASQILDNFPALLTCVQGDKTSLLHRLQSWTRKQLETHADLIEQRRQGGRVRECHGDLHAGNIVRWQGHWLPFDCLEFEPTLRWIDVLQDVAFLFMDLQGHRRRDLAYAFLNAWLESGGDYAGLPLLRLFAVYRALVRAKVDAIDPQRRFSHLAERLRIAAELADASQPALLLMHGVSGSGKSWLSGQLVARWGAVRVRSDLERRRRFGAGAYSSGATAGTYAALLEAAAGSLRGGERIIVDATFLERQARERFAALAAARGCPFLILACEAPLATLQARVRERAARGQDPSEATLEVLTAQLRQREPWSEAERARLIEIDTGSSDALAGALQAIRLHLGER